MKPTFAKFLKNRKGATAIEFAIVAPIFFMMIFIAGEFAIFLYKKNHLKHSMYVAARVLQTGEIQNSSDPKLDFQREICAVAKSSFDCTKVYFDVRTFDEIKQVQFPKVNVDQDLVPTNFTFKPGGPSKVTAMRLAAQFDFVTPYMDDFFGLDGKPMLVVGHSIARNEPYVCNKKKC